MQIYFQKLEYKNKSHIFHEIGLFTQPTLIQSFTSVLQQVMGLVLIFSL